MDAVTSGGSEIRANDARPVNFVAVCRRLLNALVTCFCCLTWHRMSSDFCPMRDSDHAECEGVSGRYNDSDFTDSALYIGGIDSTYKQVPSAKTGRQISMRFSHNVRDTHLSNM